MLAEGAYAAALGSLGSGRSMLSPPILREADAVLLLAFVGGFIDSSGYLKLQAFCILIDFIVLQFLSKCKFIPARHNQPVYSFFDRL